LGRIADLYFSILRTGILFRGVIMHLVSLYELQPNQEADFFAILSAKNLHTKKDGSPYHKVSFSDRKKTITAVVWNESRWSQDCSESWELGECYKIRGKLSVTRYGSQLELLKVRSISEQDLNEGFDPLSLIPATRVDPVELWQQIQNFIDHSIQDKSIQAIVREIYDSHKDLLLELPAATSNHHAYLAGYLEHVVSVTETACFLAEKYARDSPSLEPPLNKDLVVAGALLHDIGKVRELRQVKYTCEYSPSGVLIGHILQGRDILREFSQDRLDEEILLRLEHIIVSHQRLAEWGAPKPPMTPEALLVHYADDTDAKFHQYTAAILDAPETAEFTTRSNKVGIPIFRGLK
jgi:3'-5' exoribonuclease